MNRQLPESLSESVTITISRRAALTVLATLVYGGMILGVLLTLDLQNIARKQQSVQRRETTTTIAQRDVIRRENSRWNALSEDTKSRAIAPGWPIASQ